MILFSNVCNAELRDYISDTPAANPLLGLLGDPADQGALNALQDNSMREYLAEALSETGAIKISVDAFLHALKPQLLGFYTEGAADFHQRLIRAIDDQLSEYQDAEVAAKPWKVQ